MTASLRPACQLALLLVVVSGLPAHAQVPTHPIITELFLNPVGNDGPVGRSNGNAHQEFIEIYLPAALDLEPGLSKDALNLTLYAVEGDFTSPARGHVDWRIDLPTFDLDSSNGITPGAVERPSSGVVVLGWLDYRGDPPIDLAGTPATRHPLVNLGNPPVDFTFVAINGNQFGGTTSFPTPLAISFLDLVTHPYTGFFDNGSAAMLLMNRDHPSYTQLCSFDDPAPCTSFADLSNGVVLPVAPLLDAVAPNDDAVFDPFAQPYLAPTGESIDLENELRLGGVFSMLTPQLEELSEGYARRLLDTQKTTENALPDDPAVDQLQYREVSVEGPFVPTPGSVSFSTDGASLASLVFDTVVRDVLVGTTGRPSPMAANVGGNFGMVFTTTAMESPEAPNMSSVPTVSQSLPLGETSVYPHFAVTVDAAAPHGETTNFLVSVGAVPAGAADPPLDSSSAFSVVPVRAIDPTTGLDALGAPFQGTSFFAVQGFEDEAGVLNEFANSHLGQYLAMTAGISSADSEGKLVALVDPATDMANDLVVDPLVSELPDKELEYMNEAAPGGSLVQTILGSAEVQSGGTAYAKSFDRLLTQVNARRYTINTANGQTRTSGSPYTPADNVHYFKPDGRLDQSSGLWNVTTDRNFELAILDTNLQSATQLESGSGDDFGVVVKVASVGPSATVVPGELIFLSFMGGLEGEDIDTLAVPSASGAGVLMSAVLIDLDPLASVMDVQTVSDVYLVDANGGSRIDPLEVFSLHTELVPEPSTELALSCGVLLLAWLTRLRARRPVSPRRVRAPAR